MSLSLITCVFWICIVLLFYAFLGYPLLISCLARVRPRRSAVVGSDSTPPRATAVVVAHNESERIVDRIENLLASDYPSDRLDVLVVSDGSTDDTAAAVKALAHPRVRLIELPERCGKPAGINEALRNTDSEIVVLTDARQKFESGTIAALAAAFADPSVGAVSGSLEISAEGDPVSGGVGAYWRLEKRVRRAESVVDSSIGCTGAAYVLRAELYEPLPEDTLIDDVVIPMRVAVSGYRVLFEAAARAYEPQPFSPRTEKVRKRRTLAGNFQMLFRYPRWLLPWRNRLWWQLVSHKYLRLVGPLLLASALISNVLLASMPVYRGLLYLHVLFYLLALAGFIVPKARLKLISLPSAFVFLNLLTVMGLCDYLRGVHRSGWQRAE